MKLTKKIAVTAGLMAAAVSTPASAAIHEYTMTNGDVLSINTDTSSATFTGTRLRASLTSASFATFNGGASPVFNYILDSLDGTRLIKGKWVTDNEKNINTTHPQKLIAYSNKKVNLWAWWGNPIIGGDYITYIKSYKKITPPTEVPAPGALGLLAFGLGGMALSRSRRRKTKATVAA